jgi:spermidine synthase
VKRAIAQKPNYDMVLLDAFDADYIPEHMLTREFLNEVKSIMAPNGVIVANTFSNSALYDYESVTYKEAFGTYFNLKLANRIILGRLGGLPPLPEIQANAMKLEAALSKRGTGSSSFCRWTQHRLNQMARILTDQYSPSNLLNATFAATEAKRLALAALPSQEGESAACLAVFNAIPTGHPEIAGQHSTGVSRGLSRRALTLA